MVFITSIRYTGAIRLALIYVQCAAIRGMCVKFQQDSFKTEGFAAAVRRPDR